MGVSGVNPPHTGSSVQAEKSCWLDPDLLLWALTVGEGVCLFCWFLQGEESLSIKLVALVGVNFSIGSTSLRCWESQLDDSGPAAPGERFLGHLGAD